MAPLAASCAPPTNGQWELLGNRHLLSLNMGPSTAFEAASQRATTEQGLPLKLLKQASTYREFPLWRCSVPPAPIPTGLGRVREVEGISEAQEEPCHPQGYGFREGSGSRLLWSLPCETQRAQPALELLPNRQGPEGPLLVQPAHRPPVCSGLLCQPDLPGPAVVCLYHWPGPCPLYNAEPRI